MQNFANLEEKILKFWEENKVFEKTLEKPAPRGDFVFYDGPPFATGLPHYGHILASTIKDVIPRYKTMRGYQVRRRWGWDCHGLPIENIVENQLGISGKKQIEERGIARFNQACREGVLKYAAEWGKMVRRIGRFVEFNNSYKTMDNSYMESVWWALKQMWDKKLIYQGRKVLLYCPRCETPISNFEVAMDNSYKEVQEETVTVKFKVLTNKSLALSRPTKLSFDQSTYLLAWTTTPWTLPGNVALAVGPDISYLLLAIGDEHYIVAKERAQAVFKDQTYTVVQELKGKDLVGLEYEPLFKIPALKSRRMFKVYPADFVSTEEGTGIVHTAVVYGEEDYELGLQHKLPVVPLLDEKGVFNEKAPELIRGKYFKDSEAVIKDDLERRGLMFKREMATHAYPFCWRCETTLFYNAIPAWFVKISKLKKKLLKLNEKINWYPEHLKHGRFQKGIESAPDWNISRNRYWATPLPFWKCVGHNPPPPSLTLREGANNNPPLKIRGGAGGVMSGGCGNVVCVGSLKELQERAINYDEVYKSRDLDAIDLHRPYIDGIKLKCEKCGGTMERIDEVVDCWVESASMPFAELHYPFSAQGGSAPGGENTERFEKRYPADFVAEYIAQTRAWFYVMHVMGSVLFGKPPFKNVVTTGTILNEKGEKLSKSRKNFPDPWELIGKYGVDALRLHLMTSPVMQADNLFFNEREVDNIYKKVVLLTLNVVSFYKLYTTDQSLALSDATKLSFRQVLDRWIVARLHETIRGMTTALDKYDVVTAGRLIPGFVDDLSTWYLRRSRERFKSTKKREREQALATSAYVLATFSKLLAPFMPFLAEYVWQAVHNKSLALSDPTKLSFDSVASVHLSDWPKFQKRRIDTALLDEMKLARKVVELAHALRAEARIKVRQPLSKLAVNCQLSTVNCQLIAEEVNVRNVVVGEVQKGAGWVEKTDGPLTVSLNTTITPELQKEGLVRELSRHINEVRKLAGLTPSDTVQVLLATADPTIHTVVKEFQKPLRKATLAASIKVVNAPQETDWSHEVDLDTHEKLWIGMRRV